ncbi:monocarboxylate transporter [Plakobranchus ocellatus]|uniref:Monocarboxylate transporter n=1 Tax=Plakobranchus ocellatus TaxID=259542 RepID=A0AAV3YHM1_9GAST|nr:monocarboxylate transporter [Plakobranchus ocellatus]
MTSKSVSSAPDGGWGWVIVFCSFVIHFLGPGMLLSLSVMYVSWLEEFDSSRGLTSWTVSLCFAVFLIEGPLVATMVSRFGYRAAVIFGALLYCLGFCLSFFAASITTLIICIGGISGVGCGFLYLPAIALVAIYFEKRRSLALGLATSGTGIGSFVLAPVYHWLITTFGWRGSLLIAGGVQLNLCAVGLLMRPLNVSVSEKISMKYNSQQDVAVRESLLEEERHSKDNHDCTQRFATHLQTNGKMPCTDLHSEHLSYQVLLTNGDSKKSVGSMSHLPPPYGAQGRQFSSVSELHRKHEPQSNGTENNHLAMNVLMSGSLHSLSMIDPAGTGVRPGDSTRSVHHYENDSLNTQGPEKSCLQVFLSVFSNFTLLKRPDFLVFIISNVLTNLSYLMPALYMVDRATANGIEKGSAAMLVSIFGAGNVIGRLFCGVLGDHNIVNRTVLYILVLAVCGLATCLSPLCGSSVPLHALYAFIFGTTIGAFTTMVPMVTVDIVGVSLVGQAYGVVLLFSGIPGALGPPLAGLVYDWTGNFTAAFVLHGMFVLISALVLLPVVLLKPLKK